MTKRIVGLNACDYSMTLAKHLAYILPQHSRNLFRIIFRLHSFFLFCVCVCEWNFRFDMVEECLTPLFRTYFTSAIIAAFHISSKASI